MHCLNVYINEITAILKGVHDTPYWETLTDQAYWVAGREGGGVCQRIWTANEIEY